MTLARRRLRNLGLTGLGAALLALLVHGYEVSLRDASFFDGWLLAGTMVFLALYNVRKRIPVLPIFTSAAWLQVHVYVGLLCMLLFLNHTQYRLPNGALEIALWVLFVLVVGSGVLGLVLSRRLPRRIAGTAERIVFDRIPALRSQIARQAGDLALRAASDSGSRAIADFYARRLHGYLGRPRNFWAHLLGHDAPLRRILGELRDQHRYQQAEGRAILNEIEALIVAKDNLDNQQALQLALKLWLFVHVPLTCSIFPVTIVHAALAYAFASGAP